MTFLISAGKAKNGTIPDQLRCQISEITGYLLSPFIGLNPKPKQSGSSVRGIGRISKTGDANLRKAFYLPALTAIKYNPIVKEFAQRLSTAGKSKMVIVIAAMRKLLHIIYGVLK